MTVSTIRPYFITLLALLVLSGCAPPMANDKIIAETAKCKAAGLLAREVHENFMDNVTVNGIQCQQPFPKP